MYHYTYKITHINGWYYVGRHSTKNLDDNYMGSGKWVSSIKDKNTLNKEILEQFNTFEELLQAEQILIENNIDNLYCMNFVNSSRGFGTGKYNIIHSPGVKEKLGPILSTNSWKKTKEGREHSSKWSKIIQKELVKRGAHNFQNSLLRTKIVALTVARLKTDKNPNNLPHVKKLASDRHKKLMEEGKHQLQRPEVIAKHKHKTLCPHCSRMIQTTTIHRFHMDNCKSKNTKT